CLAQIDVRCAETCMSRAGGTTCLLQTRAAPLLVFDFHEPSRFGTGGPLNTTSRIPYLILAMPAIQGLCRRRECRGYCLFHLSDRKRLFRGRLPLCDAVRRQ